MFKSGVPTCFLCLARDIQVFVPDRERERLDNLVKNAFKAVNFGKSSSFIWCFPKINHNLKCCKTCYKSLQEITTFYNLLLESQKHLTKSLIRLRKKVANSAKDSDVKDAAVETSIGFKLRRELLFKGSEPLTNTSFPANFIDVDDLNDVGDDKPDCLEEKDETNDITDPLNVSHQIVKKKRKIVVIADEDEHQEPTTPDNSLPPSPCASPPPTPPPGPAPKFSFQKRSVKVLKCQDKKQEPASLESDVTPSPFSSTPASPPPRLQRKFSSQHLAKEAIKSQDKEQEPTTPDSSTSPSPCSSPPPSPPPRSPPKFSFEHVAGKVLKSQETDSTEGPVPVLQRNKWVCRFESCGLEFFCKYSWQRHAAQKHAGVDVPVDVKTVNFSEESIQEPSVTEPLDDLPSSVRDYKGNYRSTQEKGFNLPFLRIDYNLFLYKFSTFVEFTRSHLVCKDPSCSFHVFFDFYPSFQKMRAHIEANHRGPREFRKSRTVICLLCPTRPCKREAQFTSHFKSAHPEHRPTVAKGVCECCLKPTRYQKTFDHQFIHKNAAEKALARKLEIGPTTVLKYGQSSETFRCTEPGCTKVLSNRSNLFAHLKRHLRLEDRPDLQMCPECGAKLLGKASLVAHMRRAHPPERVESISCPVCSKKFLPEDRIRLETHLKWHRGETRFLCEACGKGFVSQGILNGHVRIVHNTGDYSCDQCEKKFTKLAAYRCHWLRHHHSLQFPLNVRQQYNTGSGFYFKGRPARQGPPRKWPCDKCDAVCMFWIQFKEHMSEAHGIQVKRQGGRTVVVKTGEGLPGDKRWQCDHCELSYCRKFLLTKHIEKKHQTTGH